MKLEHHKQQLVPIPHFLKRVGKYTLFAFSLIVLSVFLGTAGYHQLAELSWIDSFYMSCMILTGMGPVADMSSVSAKLFSSLYALYSGIAFLTITAVFFTPIIHRILHILQVERDDEKD